MMQPQADDFFTIPCTSRPGFYLVLEKISPKRKLVSLTAGLTKQVPVKPLRHHYWLTFAKMAQKLSALSKDNPRWQAFINKLWHYTQARYVDCHTTPSLDSELYMAYVTNRPPTAPKAKLPFMTAGAYKAYTQAEINNLLPTFLDMARYKTIKKEYDLNFGDVCWAQLIEVGSKQSLTFGTTLYNEHWRHKLSISQLRQLASSLHSYATATLGPQPQAPTRTTRHTVGIAHPHPNLWTGQALDRQGNLFYLGFERVQPDNLSFWEAYARMSEVIATKYGFVISNSARGKAHKSAPYFAQMFPSLQAYHAMSQQIARDPERYRKLKASLGGGLAGFGTTLLGMKIPKNNWQGYIVYASRTPITEPLANRHYMGMDGQPKSMAQLEETGRFACYGPQDKDFYQEYANNFGQLIMTMTSTTQPNSPSATHLGISRNPLKFVRAEREYPKISLILHGFASECEKMLGKQVQVNRPISGMQKILQQALPAGTVWTDRCPLGALEPLEHAHGGCNPLIGFDLAACAKFYQAAQPAVGAKPRPKQPR